MKEGLKLKKGCSFHFEGQTYEGGKKRDTIPPEVLARVEKLKNKPDLEKLRLVDEKAEKKELKDDGKSKGKS
jgi:hypothetical protein